MFYGALRAGVPLHRVALFKRAAGVQMRCLLDRLSVNCVLDVGAHHGEFGSRLRALGYRGLIVSFEPNPEAFAILQHRMDRDPQWIGRAIALGSEDGHRELHIHSNSVLSSFHNAVSSQAYSSIPFVTRSIVRGSTVVPVQRLDGILPGILEKIAKPRVLLKMDTQGWDIEVLRGASQCLGSIDALLTEVSLIALYDQMTPFYKAIEECTKWGFDIIDMDVVNRTADGRVIEYDCLMVKRAQ